MKKGQRVFVKEGPNSGVYILGDKYFQDMYYLFDGTNTHREVESNIEVLTDDTDSRDVSLMVALTTVALVMAFVMPSAIIGLAIGAVISAFLYRI
jgi:hypothetical protein